MDQVEEPVGATPPTGPETVAVNVMVELNAAVAELVVMTTFGVTLSIVIENG